MTTKINITRTATLHGLNDLAVLSLLVGLGLVYLLNVEPITAAASAPFLAAAVAAAMYLISALACLAMRAVDRVAAMLHMRRSPLA